MNAARWAISIIFLLNGAGIGLWAAHVPLVQARAGIDTGARFAITGVLLMNAQGLPPLFVAAFPPCHPSTASSASAGCWVRPWAAC